MPSAIAISLVQLARRCARRHCMFCSRGSFRPQCHSACQQLGQAFVGCSPSMGVQGQCMQLRSRPNMYNAYFDKARPRKHAPIRKWPMFAGRFWVPKSGPKRRRCTMHLRLLWPSFWSRKWTNFVATSFLEGQLLGSRLLALGLCTVLQGPVARVSAACLAACLPGCLHVSLCFPRLS